MMKWLRDSLNGALSVVEREVWLPRRRRFPGNRAPTNDEGRIAEPERSLELTLQPPILGSEIRIGDRRNRRLIVSLLPVLARSAASSLIKDDATSRTAD